MKFKNIKETQGVYAKYIFGVVLLFVIIGVLICANVASASYFEDRYYGTYAAKRNTDDGRQTLTLELKKNGNASLNVMNSKFSILPRSYNGSWQAINAGRIEVIIKRGPDRDSFVFILENNFLSPVSWNREEWGKSFPDFEKKSVSDDRDKYPTKYLGTYYANIKRYGSDQTLILTIKNDGYASLRKEAKDKYNITKDGRYEDENNQNDYRKLVIDLYNWFEVENNVIRVETTKGKNYKSFTLRKVNDRLETINWDCSEWGYSTVKFSKNENYNRPDADNIDNNHKPRAYDSDYLVAYSNNGFKRKKLDLDLLSDNTAVLVVTEGINERTYKGTWDNLPFGAIKVLVRRGDKSVRFDLRRFRRDYQTTYWNKEDWGDNPLVFSRR